MSERNPYVMLGIAFGAPRDVATRAFARKAKGRRRSKASGDSVELTDLTWALNQVSEAIRDPRTAVGVYRVPADPIALEPHGEGVLRPGPEYMPRSTVSSTAEWDRLLDTAREEAAAAFRNEIASSSTLPER